METQVSKSDLLKVMAHVRNTLSGLRDCPPRNQGIQDTDRDVALLSQAPGDTTREMRQLAQQRYQGLRDGGERAQRNGFLLAMGGAVTIGLGNAIPALFSLYTVHPVLGPLLSAGIHAAATLGSIQMMRHGNRTHQLGLARSKEAAQPLSVLQALARWDRCIASIAERKLEEAEENARLERLLEPPQGASAPPVRQDEERVQIGGVVLRRR